MISVNVNETAVQLENDANINVLLSKVNTPPKGIAVAVNNAIISKSKWNEARLQDNDNILIIKATQGG